MRQTDFLFEYRPADVDQRSASGVYFLPQMIATFDQKQKPCRCSVALGLIADGRQLLGLPRLDDTSPRQLRFIQ